MRHTNPLHALLNITLTGALASVLTTALHAADAEFCMQYSRDMISMPQVREGAPKTCQPDQPYWNTDKSAHIKSCLAMSQEEANKRRYNHNKLVNLCNDSYKIIMLDRKRLANLPLGPNEPRELQPAPSAFKTLLTSGKLQNPYTKRYENIQQALLEGKLNACDFFSLPVDMGNNPKTREWVVTIDEQCVAKAIDTHQPPVWIIQQLENRSADHPAENSTDKKKPTFRVLFQGQHHTLTLHYSEHNHYRTLTIATPLSKQEETANRCGSIIADWHYEQGRYIPFRGKADEHGDCLPEYELPDYLQGANTFDLAEGEWQKGMEEAEKERTALMAPYKKALQDYIPEWITKMQQQIPANEAQAAEPASNATRSESSSPATPPESQKEKEDKSFMDNVRDFLGLD